MALLPNRSYDYLLKFLLVGDSDVGKEEILNLLEDGDDEVYASHSGVKYKTITILLEGKWVKLQLWDTFGQGRFSTIIRSYSRGAQGILLVYDITNRWSFSGIDRWIKEINEQVPGIPKILIGNRLHLEFRRAVPRSAAEAYAAKNNMEYFEVSPLADFNISESLTELSRLVVNRNGMHRILKPTTVNSLQDLCCRCVVRHMKTVYGIDHLPVPQSLRLQLRSFANSELLSASNTFSLRRHARSPSDGFGSPISPANLRLANADNIVKIKRLMSLCGVGSSNGRSNRGSYNVNTADTDGPSNRISNGQWHSADSATVVESSESLYDRLRRRRSQHSSGQTTEDSAESTGRRSCKLM